nr:low temperature requirement protein A [uncultured Roseateles sp.]
MSKLSQPLLRSREGHGGRVSFAELFFDLIYVFAVTQLSHHLLEHLTPLGALQTLLLWFAVWLGWQYTSWVTNWFDPEALPIRVLLFVIMGVGLVMAAALPEAFGERGLVFAGCYALIQVGRSAYVLWQLGAGHALTPNFRRILGWTLISAGFWLAGGLAQEGSTRLALWAVAVACEYVSPMLGFYLPGLGRSQTRDWTIDGGHLVERCSLFVIIALGESILVTGATVAHVHGWTAPVLIAALLSFAGSLAMWWLYFDTGSKAAEHLIVHAQDPGRYGALYHYVHVLIVAGIIVCAVASDLAIAHPDAPVKIAYAAVLLGGPALYVLGNAIYKRIVFGRLPLSHLVGLAGLALLVPLAGLGDLLLLSSLVTVLLIMVAFWEMRSRQG